MPTGAIVISFDFELAWGLRGEDGDESQLAGIEQAQDVVHRLLAILVEHDISATWATVGHLMLREEDCPAGHYPFDLPSPGGQGRDGDWYDAIPLYGSQRAAWYYAPAAVEAICASPVYQELAAHTFSHVLIGHGGCSADVARAEFARCQQLAARLDRELHSVVFPRNLIGHLPVIRQLGFTSYRARNSEWYWLGHPNTIDGRRWLRAAISPLRYVDERFGLCPPLPPARRVEGLWEIPHSMFFPGLRGVSRFISPEARVDRAVKGMRSAAEAGRIFSLFTHPHNFLPDPDRLLPAFAEICAEAARLRKRGDLVVVTMAQAAAELEAGRMQHWLRRG